MTPSVPQRSKEEWQLHAKTISLSGKDWGAARTVGGQTRRGGWGLQCVCVCVCVCVWFWYYSCCEDLNLLLCHIMCICLPYGVNHCMVYMLPLQVEFECRGLRTLGWYHRSNIEVFYYFVCSFFKFEKHCLPWYSKSVLWTQTLHPPNQLHSGE